LRLKTKKEITMKSEIIQKLDKESSPIFDKVAAKMRTASRIADAMKAAGLSKSQFARKMGKSPSEITKWLSGTHNFTIDSLQEISAVLGVEITSAMDYSNCESPMETITVTIPQSDRKLFSEIALKFGWACVL